MRPHEDKLFASGPVHQRDTPLSLLVSTAQRGRGRVWWDEGKAAGFSPFAGGFAVRANSGASVAIECVRTPTPPPKFSRRRLSTAPSRNFCKILRMPGSLSGHNNAVRMFSGDLNRLARAQTTNENYAEFLERLGLFERLDRLTLL